jgi:8-oxo-dGTP diphosphatase
VIIRVIGAVIRDDAGRLLTVRKAGSTIFMLPGGKPEPGEDDIDALRRELLEELGVALRSAVRLGAFEAPAANEPGARVQSNAYVVQIEGAVAPAAEIAEIRWIDPAAPDAPLAQLLRDHVLPAIRS